MVIQLKPRVTTQNSIELEITKLQSRKVLQFKIVSNQPNKLEPNLLLCLLLLLVSQYGTIVLRVRNQQSNSLLQIPVITLHRHQWHCLNSFSLPSSQLLTALLSPTTHWEQEILEVLQINL